MIDECEHCEYKGDLAACLEAECSQHESWYAKAQQNQITKLEKVAKASKDLLNDCINFNGSKLTDVIMANMSEALSELERSE